jgi:hypothetical protein
MLMNASMENTTAIKTQTPRMTSVVSAASVIMDIKVTELIVVALTNAQTQPCISVIITPTVPTASARITAHANTVLSSTALTASAHLLISGMEHIVKILMNVPLTRTIVMQTRHAPTRITARIANAHQGTQGMERIAMI